MLSVTPPLLFSPLSPHSFTVNLAACLFPSLSCSLPPSLFVQTLCSAPFAFGHFSPCHSSRGLNLLSVLFCAHSMTEFCSLKGKQTQERFFFFHRVSGKLNLSCQFLTSRFFPLLITNQRGLLTSVDRQGHYDESFHNHLCKCVIKTKKYVEN